MSFRLTLKYFTIKDFYKKLFFPENSGNRFANLNYRPNLLTIMRNMPYLIFRNYMFVKSYFRDYKYARIRNEKLVDENPPNIELLICSTQKDFQLLNLVINNALNYSNNPIIKITILVPGEQINSCINVLDDFSVKIEVVDENKYLTISLKEMVRNFLPEKYGWVVQQLLIINFTLHSNSHGVLQIDSDTILTSAVTWLDNHGNQIIYPTSSYYAQYSSVLNQLDRRLCNNKLAFVSHHMLFQPSLLKKMFVKLNLSDTEELFNRVVKICDLKDQSPFCLEYELYGQSLLYFFKSKVLFSNFANYSYSLNSRLNYDEIIKWLDKNGRNYKSVSFHSYS